MTASFDRNYVGEVVNAGDGDAADGNNPANNVDVFEVGALRRSNNHPNGLYPSYIYGRKGANELGDYKLSNASNCPDPDAKQLIMTVIGGRNDWNQWFIDLVSAYQTGGLSAANVGAYFAWLGMGQVDGTYIANNICKLSGGISKIAENDVTRDLLREGKWTQYRLNFATVVGQLAKMVNEVPEEYMKIFSSKTRDAIEAARIDNWSEPAFRAIGTRPLAVLQAWLMVSEQEIENLWSAKSAYSELSIAEKKSLHNWFSDAIKEIKVYESGMLSSYKNLPQSLRDI